MPLPLTPWPGDLGIQWFFREFTIQNGDFMGELSMKDGWFYGGLSIQNSGTMGYII